jgi:hypothetical protein
MIRLCLMLFISALFGCRGCNEPLRSEVNDREKVLLRPFEIEPSALFDWSKYFVFSSKVELTLGKTGEQSISREFIEAKGSDGQIHLSKKIDDAHYFEVFADEQNYFVKNREGEWRENRDNKPFVQALIKDGFNANDWVIEHLALAEFLLKDTKRSTTNKNIYVLQNAKIKPEAPFWQNLFQSSPDFKDLKEATITGFIETEARWPRVSSFTIEASLENGHWLRLSTESTLTKSAPQPLIKPQAVKEGPLLYPVNIVPKFNELMGTKPS